MLKHDSYFKDHSGAGVQYSLFRIYITNALFCTVIALIIWITVPQESNPGFLSNFVHAQLIGSIICTFLLLSRFLSRRFNLLPDRLTFFAMPFAIITGLYVGSAIARYLLGLPEQSIESYSDRHLLIVSLVLTVVVTVAINGYFSTQNTIAKLRIKAAEESERAAQAQLSTLLAQIEPHMLFNTLANLRALISSDPEKALEMLDLLNDFLRATLRQSRTESVCLESEFRMLDNYLQLLSVRFGDRLTYTTVLPKELKDCSIPSLLLQPIVENAIKHGIEPSIDGGSVVVTAASSGGTLTLCVEDTGVGIPDTNKILKSSPDTDINSEGGFGMVNVQARCLTQPGGTFGVFSPVPNGSCGTKVQLQIPLRYEKR